MKSIVQPAVRLIKTNPSVLGGVDYHWIIFDQKDFNTASKMKWLDDNEALIAEELYETAAYKGIFVIHSTSDRGHSIRKVNNFEKDCTYNRINCDSVLVYHCLAIETKGTDILIQTGFHEVLASENEVALQLNGNNISSISNGVQSLTCNRKQFQKLYEGLIR